MTATPIRTPSHPISEELSDEVRAQVDRVAERVAAGANWKVRKKTMFDFLVAVHALATQPVEQRAAILRALHGDQDTGPAEDFALPGRPEALVLLYAGAVLERLGETSMTSAEQAAVYALSVHPEHGESVLDWMRSDRRNTVALRRIMRHDRTFRTLQRSIDDALSEGGGFLPPADDDPT